jgi:hypothetical protein
VDNNYFQQGSISVNIAGGNVSVFIKKPLIKVSWWQKLWTKQIPDNLVIEINNLLASKPLLEITPDQVNQICSKYDAVTVAKSQRCFSGYYHLYLEQCLLDKRLTEQEIAELAHLKLLLRLSDRVIKQTHNATASRLYGAELEQRMADGSISYEEQQFLQELSDNLLLPKERTEEIRNKQAVKHVDTVLDDIMSDERITPEEEENFEALVRNLGYRPEMAEQTRQNYERYKLYWRLENEPLPQVSTKLQLEGKERCCFVQKAGWFEAEGQTRQPGFNVIHSNGSYSKAFSWKTGYPEEVTDMTENWQQLDTGELVLTNQRLVFRGEKKEQEFKLSEINNFVPYSDGIRLELEDKRSIIFPLSRNTDLLVILLKRLLGN